MNSFLAKYKNLMYLILILKLSFSVVLGLGIFKSLLLYHIYYEVKLILNITLMTNLFE
jgi:hypothetical protein